MVPPQSRSLPPASPADRQAALLRRDLLRAARLAAAADVAVALAHELNQPLTALILYLQAVRTLGDREENRLSPAMGALIDKAIHESERAAEIVHRMRDRGLPTYVAPQDCAVSTLLDDAITVASYFVPNGISVELEIAPDLRALAEPSHVHEQIVALLIDASAAVDPEAPLRLAMRARKQGHRIEITVDTTASRIGEADGSGAAGPGSAGSRTARPAAPRRRGADVTIDAGETPAAGLFTLHFPVA